MRRIFLVLLTISLMIGQAVAAENRHVTDTIKYYDQPLDELLSVETQLKAEVGSRSGSRDALEAEVPIDVITSEQLEASGYTEVGKVLSKLIPGFNFPRPSITDGTDHAPPFTLRGLNPDQVLVLINGKRLHQSSLLNINGTIGRGSSGVDINSIPVRAIERIEVLRDGAAAQYGSDAIAGIINIILKGYGYSSSLHSSVGKTTKGDGLMKQADLFFSKSLSEDGYINITAEARHRGSSNRAGGDIRDNGIVNTHFGDADTRDYLLAVNTSVPRGDTTFYLHGILDRRLSSSGAFYRLRNDDRNIPEIYPDGFLPLIEPKIFDFSVTAGLKGVMEKGLKWDLSYTHGFNDYHFYVSNSLNRSLGLATPTSFNAGGTKYTQQTVNLDLTKKINSHNISGGVEFRQENYKIISGEPASYELGQYADWYPGSQGFSGFSPDNEVSAKRQNYAAYLDLKYNLMKGVTIDAATRAEHYSDFGSTLDGKLALRLRPNSDILIRSSISSGFRAPSLTQSHFTYTQMIRDGNEIWMYGNLSVKDPIARALGATDLKPERSRHYTAGVVYQPLSNLSISADYFITDIHDRIMPTGYIAGWNLSGLSDAALEILSRNNIDGVVYFTNAIGTRTKGIDLRLEYKLEISSESHVKLAGSYHSSSTKIRKVNKAPAILGVNMTDLILDPYTRVTIEGGQPKDAVKLWTMYKTRLFDVVLNLNRFGSFSSTKDSEKITFGSKWTVDAEVSYRLKKNITLTVGGENILNSKPDEWGVTEDNLMGSGKIIRYSQYAPFGYNGAYYYVRLGISL